MSNCCTSQASTKSARHVCPVNGQAYPQVSMNTIMHHLKAPWQYPLKQQAYFFCDDPTCEVVYFGEDNAVINQAELRTPVGLKEQADDALICYCYGVSRADALNTPEAKAFVVEQTRKGGCACEMRNPSGRCCLKDFPKA